MDVKFNYCGDLRLNNITYAFTAEYMPHLNLTKAVPTLTHDGGTIRVDAIIYVVGDATQDPVLMNELSTNVDNYFLSIEV